MSLSHQRSRVTKGREGYRFFARWWGHFLQFCRSRALNFAKLNVGSFRSTSFCPPHLLILVRKIYERAGALLWDRTLQFMGRRASASIAGVLSNKLDARFVAVKCEMLEVQCIAMAMYSSEQSVACARIPPQRFVTLCVVLLSIWCRMC